MTNPHYRNLDGGAIDVTLTNPAEPLWLPIVTRAGRTPVTVIAGPAESGKTSLLEHLEREAFTAGVHVIPIRPLDPAARIDDVLTNANNAIDLRQAGAERAPLMFSLDDTAFLIDQGERSRALNRIAVLGPAVGVGLLLTAETILGHYRARPVPQHDQAVILGDGDPMTGFGEFKLFRNRMTGHRGHYLDFTGARVGFEPIRAHQQA